MQIICVTSVLTTVDTARIELHPLFFSPSEETTKTGRQRRKTPDVIEAAGPVFLTCLWTGLSPLVSQTF